MSMNEQVKKSIEEQVENAKGNAIHVVVRTNIKAKVDGNGNAITDHKETEAYYKDIESASKCLLGENTLLMKAQQIINLNTGLVTFDIVIGKGPKSDIFDHDSEHQVEQIHERMKQRHRFHQDYNKAYHSADSDEQKRLEMEYREQFGSSLFKDAKDASRNQHETALVLEYHKAGKPVSKSKPLKLKPLPKISTPRNDQDEPKELELTGVLTDVTGSKNFFEFGTAREKTKVFFDAEQYDDIRNNLFKECYAKISRTRESHSSGILHQATLVSIRPIYDGEIFDS